MDRRTTFGTIAATTLAGGIAATIGVTAVPLNSAYHDILLYGGLIGTFAGLAGLIGLFIFVGKKEQVSAATETYNVHNSGSGFALGHGTVNIGEPRFELTEERLAELVTKLDRRRPVSLIWRNTGRTVKMVPKLKQYLLTHGFTLGGEMSFAQMTGFDFDEPILFSSDGLRSGGVTLMGGAQVIAIDASVA